MTEDQIHKSVVEWLRYRAPDLLYFHVPNQGKLPVQYRAKLKAMGLLPGVSDLVFVGLFGRACFVELKAPNKGQSKAQKEFQKAAEAHGCPYAVCRSIDDVEGTLTAWGLL